MSVESHPGGGRTLAAKWLNKNNLTRQEIAEVLDIHPTRISRWCSGAEECHPGALYATVLYLLGEDAEQLEQIEADELTDEQRERVIVALRSVELCEAAFQERQHVSTKT
jgi:hypothetical protein